MTEPEVYAGIGQGSVTMSPKLLLDQGPKNDLVCGVCEEKQRSSATDR
jgi:hypothetical protein